MYRFINNFIWVISMVKYIGIIGFLAMGDKESFFWNFMIFWVLGIIEIILTLPSFIQALNQVFGNLFVIFKKISGINKNQVEIIYGLPFKGEWIAINGGVTPKMSHSWYILSQRYAYDFLIKDEKGSSFSGSYKKLENYYCYEQEIIAPADGVVIELNDTQRDSTMLGYGRVDKLVKDIRGNYVIIKHSDTQFSLLAHLKFGSICVKKGQCIKRGEKIALCGNSGNSTEPHLHFQIQDNKNFFLSTGVKIKFNNIICIDNEKNKEKSFEFIYEDYIYINKGMKVANFTDSN
ncbi:M23 family metallopeptidase [Clostridioides difficile]|nr:M23 family metallopeptidase [Clostridioides difficile]MCZ1114099.1 M23 family metallopeptidase [Clostridioides difficile]MDI6393628.1 M23 family metallopeptidase [Clostridioides difficile]